MAGNFAGNSLARQIHSSACRRLRRLAMPTKPVKPVPSSNRVVGSGTVEGGGSTCPLRTAKTYLPRTSEFRRLPINLVPAGPVSKNDPGTLDPGSSNDTFAAPEAPFEYPTAADTPPSPPLPPLASPVSHWIRR